MREATRSSKTRVPSGGAVDGQGGAQPASTATAAVPTPEEAHRRAAAVVLNDFLVLYLGRLYREFDGDLLLALVLGEIAHHNISGMGWSVRSPLAFSAALHRALMAGEVPRLPTNAFSIAQATGIPRQTVRRKLVLLEARGWIARDSTGNLTVTSKPREHFAAWNDELRREFLAAAVAVLELERALGDRAEAPRARTRAPRG